MRKFTDVVQSRTGQALPGATVTVRVANVSPGTGALATIYSDDGITLVPGSAVTTDANGRYSFFAADGQFDLTVTGVSIVTQTVGDIGEPSSLTCGSLSVAGAGVFTNTQQNDLAKSDINSLNVGTEYSAQQGGNFATEATVGAIAVPNTSTVHQANGIAGYIANSSTTTFGVGVYGQAKVAAASSSAYGANFVAADSAGSPGSIVGCEVDINVNNTTSPVTGYSLQGAWAAQPTSATAFSIGTITGKKWINGLVYGGGATANSSGAAIVLNQSATGASQDSQQIQFNSSSKGAIFRLVDTNGFLFTNVGYYAPLFSTNNANPSASGQVRFGSTEAIGWRNNANGADILLGKTGAASGTFNADTLDASGFGGIKLAGISHVKRLHCDQGTAYSGADAAIVLGAGWGSTAAVSAARGNDQALQFTVTANGAGIAASPTIAITFKDGTFVNAPVVIAKQVGGTGAQANPITGEGSALATSVTLTVIFTPSAGVTYVFNVLALGV